MICSLKHTGSWHLLHLPPTSKNNPESAWATSPRAYVVCYGTWPGCWGDTSRAPGSHLPPEHTNQLNYLHCWHQQKFVFVYSLTCSCAEHSFRGVNMWQFLGPVQSHKFYLQAGSEERNLGQSLYRDGVNVYHLVLLKSTECLQDQIWALIISFPPLK